MIKKQKGRSTAS